MRATVCMLGSRDKWYEFTSYKSCKGLKIMNNQMVHLRKNRKPFIPRPSITETSTMMNYGKSIRKYPLRPSSATSDVNNKTIHKN